MSTSTTPKPAKLWQVLLMIGIAIVVVVAVLLGWNVVQTNRAAQAEAAEQAQIASAQQAEHDALVVKFSEPITAAIEKNPAPDPVTEPPTEDPGDGGGGEYVPGQSGDLVPFIATDDPNNANGGDYIDPGIYCLAGSASGNPPVCD